MMKTILVTGGAGFIGSNFVNWLLGKYKDFTVINLDNLTYAGNTDNLKNIENSPRYKFIKGDICDANMVNTVLEKYGPDYIVNFAAESHVDRSISNPLIFAQTNIIGVAILLDTAHRLWGKTGFDGKSFVQVSTDEVYGSIGQEGIPFSEESPLLPNSPYSASKASADLMVRSFVKTYRFPAIITRCCNNYGPRQYTEKFIPTCITNALRNEPIPVYGDGTNIREWIHVLDHCEAIAGALFEGKPGEIYNIGSGDELSNIDLAKIILNCLHKPQDLIKMVSDRPGHDFRYALNSGKAKRILGWTCKYKFKEGIQDTINWYAGNQNFISW